MLGVCLLIHWTFFKPLTQKRTFMFEDNFIKSGFYKTLVAIYKGINLCLVQRLSTLKENKLGKLCRLCIKENLCLVVSRQKLYFDFSVVYWFQVQTKSRSTELLALQCYKVFGQKGIESLPQNSGFLIPISFDLNVVDLRYFKL